MKIELMKNPENVRRHRRDIAQALGREWDEEEFMTNDMYIGGLWGNEVDKIDSLGLLNRGFCSLCGLELPSNDPRYSRAIAFLQPASFCARIATCEQIHTWIPPTSSPNVECKS